MGTWTKTNLWGFVILFLPGGLGGNGWEVYYPQPICALQGSTVTIPCTYKYPARYTVKSLVWCKDHEICQYPTAFVYNSSYPQKYSRYKYLGDFTTNCTLQIERIGPKDSKVHRFRIEAEGEQYTARSGVRVNVVLMRMKIASAGARRIVSAGDTITLTCNATCSFHQSNISWYRNDVAVPETSPSLQLKSLTVEDSGNYSCALKTYEATTRSNLYNLSVEEPLGSLTESPLSKHMIIGIVIGVLLALLTTVVAALLIIKRRRAEVQKNRDSVRVPPADSIYSTVGEPVQPQMAEKEEVSYATVQFKYKTSPGRPAHQHREDTEDPVIYSAVSRGQ